MKNKSPNWQAKSYREIGEYWEALDLGKNRDKNEEVNFEVDMESDVFYYAIETSLLFKLCLIAERRSVSVETLVNLWLQERLQKEILLNNKL